MTTLVDGPAAGKTLMLRRAVTFLRVTQRRFQLGEDTGEEFDALDQPEDTPRPDETLLCYLNTGKRGGGAFVDFSGNKKHLSGYYVMAEYAFYPDQPPDEVMRDNARWQEWRKQQALTHNIKHA